MSATNPVGRLRMGGAALLLGVGTVKLHVEAGAQTLKLWRVDPGVVVQRIELARGTLPPSYLGPPESARSGN